MPGKLVHFELPAQDTGRAKAFWSGVFGWSFSDSAMPGIEYYMVRTGEDQGGAVLASDRTPSGPIIYFDTDDIDA
jgi:predicted enzyme related to lactoylglutathione lyase